MKITDIKTLLEEISPWPWCESYTYNAIRHVERNCDLECDAETHPPAGECKHFDKNDGTLISKMPEIISQLLKQIEVAREALEFYGSKNSWSWQSELQGTAIQRDKGQRSYDALTQIAELEKDEG